MLHSERLRRFLKTCAGALVAIAFLGAGVYQAWLLQFSSGSGSGNQGELIYLPSPKQARVMALGYNSVVADYYWVKGLQYFTDPSLAKSFYKNLADYLEVVLGLDPDFKFAYKFAGMAVPFDAGRQNWKNTRRATSFLERGVERFPDNWELHFFLGYNYLNYENRPDAAAKHFEAASRLEGAPSYLAAFAARLYSVAGNTDRAIAFAEQTLQSTSDPEIRAMMFGRLNDLRVEVELQRIERSAQAFKEARGRMPQDIKEPLPALLNPPPPEGYWLDAEGVAHPPSPSERMIIHENLHDKGKYIAE